MKKYLFLFLSLISVSAFAQAPLVDINTAGAAGAYSQDFNSLISTGSATWVQATASGYTLAGWQAASTNLTNIVSGTGSSATGAIYSYGALSNSDRALGSVASGSTNSLYFGVVLKNNTGGAVSSVQISYIGEQWRSANAAVQKLNFGYKTGTGLATALGAVTTGFTAYTALDFSSPNLTNTLAINGNLAANRTAISNTITVSLAAGDEIFIRWEDLNDAGNDHAMGVDSLVVIFNAAASAPAVTVNAASAIAQTSAQLNGLVNANGASTTVTFKYGTTATYGTTAVASQSPVNGTSATSVSAALSSLSANTLYHYTISAVNSVNTTTGPDSTFYTLANVPGAPSVTNPSASTLDITLNTGSNPSNTEFAIQDPGSGQYVQANGTLASSPVWQTEASWSTKTITGLTASTNYAFRVKARNGNNVETGFSSNGSGMTSAGSCTPSTTNNPQTICNGSSYVINGHTYTIAGDYNDTFMATGGCDSIIVTQLTVNPTYNNNNPQTICAGRSYSFNGHTYTIAGNYNDTLQTVNGCDSIITTQLTVNPTYTVNNPQAICQGNAYSFNGHSYTSAGNYNDTLHTVNGCDSIVVTQITVNPTYTTNNPQAICNGGSYNFNGHTYTVAGNYNDTLISISGCDSIIITQLTLNPVYNINNPQTICNGGAYSFNGHTYATAGNYNDTLLSINGCDSIITTVLTVNPVYSVNNPQTICNGNSYSFNGHIYTTAGNYNDTLHTVNGCDSIVVTMLTVNPTYTSNNPQTICNGSSYSFNGHTYTTAGNYNDTLHTVNGCDSIIVTMLTVNPTYTSNNPQTICNGSSYSFNGHTYITAGNHNDTLHTANGCDSIIVTMLTVNLTYTSNNPQTICNGSSYSFNGHTYTIAGNYNDTLHAVNGCDSIIVTILTIAPVYSVNNPQTICNGSSYAFNGHTYITAGNYNDTLHSVNGCDSIIVTQLTVNPVYTANNPQTICNGSSYSFNGHTYTVAGNYNDTLHSVNGCDSIITTMLTVNPTFSSNNPHTICNGSSYSFNGHTYTVAGNYNDTLHSVNGCDSIIITQLTVNPTYSINNPQAVCPGAAYSFNGHTYSSAGTYRDTLSTVNGCDSIIVTVLTVNPVYSINNPQVICNGSSYTINGHSYSTAGTYNDTLTSVNGCDSIVITQVSLTSSFTVNNPQTVCDGGSYTFNGHTYSVAGNYNDTLTTASGCDSIIVTQLTVGSSYTVNNPKTICNGASYTLNGHTYTTAGNYNDTLHTVNGCDSIIVTMLTVNPTYTSNNPKTICNGSSYSFNGHTYSTAGNYNDTLHTVNGCDSIIVTQLTVNPVYSVSNPQTICSGNTYSFNGHSYATAASYRDTLHTVNGCDSIIVTQLTVNPVYSVSNPQTICSGGLYSFNGHTYSTAGNYNDTLHTVNGCDSIIVTTLTVNPTFTSNNPQTICNGSSYSFNGHTYSTAGNYNDTLHTINGCDSIIVTVLTVNPTYTSNNPQTICNGNSYSFNGRNYSTAGNYNDTLHSVNGCDSIIVTVLAVNPTYTSNNPQTICNGNSYSFNGHNYSTAGNYNDTLHTINGCDSIIVTVLTVNPTYASNNPQTICNGSSYPFNGHTYSTAGNYNDTLHTVNGCDSIIVTMLTVNPTYTSNNPQTICNGSSYSFNGHTYSTAGNYNDTLHSVNGCDSIIVTVLTVNPTFTSNNPRTICNGSSYSFNGHTYSTAGNYNDTLHTVNGCDSIIVTTLTVNPTFTSNNPQTICNGSSYAFNGHTYSTAGNYNDTLHTVNGCDSIIVTVLTVNPTYASNNPQTICNGNSYVFNGHTYTATGNYNDTLHTVNGCDSIIVTMLTVNPTFTSNNPRTICNGSSYSFNGHTYSTAGNYNDTLHTINGCDSIIVTMLTVNPTFTSNNPQTICNGSSYSFNGHTYSTAGNYNDTLHAVNGCDSIIVTMLTVNPTFTSNNSQTICNGSSYVFNGHTYTTAGNYNDTLYTVNGCDSIIVTVLTVNPTFTSNNPQTICNGSSYVFNGHTYSTAGNYNDTLHTVNGCDSIIVTMLTVNPTFTSNNPQTICNGSSYAFNGHTYITTGNYNDTLHTVNGCDSIIVTMLTVNPTYTSNNPQTICNGSSYPFNGHMYTTAGNYNDTLHTANGCDSIIVTVLTVNPTYTSNNPQTICNGSSYAFNGHTYTTAGNYNDTLHTVNGCDSIIVTMLTVNPTYTSNNPQTICNGSSYVFNGHTYSTAGNYNDTLHTVNGCDSIIVTMLTVNPTYSISNPQTICGGSSYLFNGHTYTTAGNYNDTLHSVTGCDSIIVTQLIVNPKPTTSTISGNGAPMMTTSEVYSVVNTSGSTYNWIITGGTQTTGGNTNNITVLWGTSGIGGVKVIETNLSGCIGDTISQVTLISFPVDLISFTGTRSNSTVNLNWITASELNNSHFTVQRSSDGKHFASIGTVKGQGTKTSITRYEYIDNISNTTGTIYYRLIQTDYDGTSATSPVISVETVSPKNIAKPVVYPNPFTDALSIQLQTGGTTEITIMDLNGKVVLQSVGSFDASAPVTIYTNELKSGMYFVRIKHENSEYIQKILKD